MWDGLWIVLSLGGIMALASFLAGSLPLSFSLTHRQMRLISAIGTGLLVGTALIVIIPEGIETMYSANANANGLTHAFSQTSPKSATLKGVVDEAVHGGKGALAALASHGVGPQQQQNEQAGRAEELAHLGQRDLGAHVHYAIGSLVKRASKASTHAAHEEHAHSHEESSHAWIGIALVVGFILMYLIDALQSSGTNTHSTRGHHIPLSQVDSSDAEAGPAKDEPPSPHQHGNGKSTTIGLVIHSFADGIALGASSASTSTSKESQSNLSLIVFAAILIHKAPAAFGLTSVLLKQGLGKRAARAHLLLFSLAAPLGALATWALVNLLGGVVEGGNATWWTGLVLVFSGGTFLYVAMHAMQETSMSSGSGHGERKSKADVVLMTVGMLLPLLTQVGHAHAHGG